MSDFQFMAPTRDSDASISRARDVGLIVSRAIEDRDEPRLAANLERHGFIAVQRSRNARIRKVELTSRSEDRLAGGPGVRMAMILFTRSIARSSLSSALHRTLHRALVRSLAKHQSSKRKRLGDKPAPMHAALRSRRHRRLARPDSYFDYLLDAFLRRPRSDPRLA
jgi:hypothetical protein